MSERLSREQQAVLDAALRGESIFITGAGGTGKSLVLMHIISSLRHNKGKRVAVVAPTGYAAMRVQGRTIHSWVGIGQVSSKEAAQNLKKWNREAWAEVHVLVIDEISMVSDWMFELLDRMARTSRKGKGKLPFGGVQLILCGDFMQMPPIKAQYCFQSPLWKQAISSCFELTRPYRQEGDGQFASLLNDLRLGVNVDAHIATLKQARKRLPEHDGIEPTRLYAKRESVDEENMLHLNRLPGEEMCFNAVDSSNKIMSSWTAPQILRLKVGAQVVLLRNLEAERGLVNGARGVVIAFADCNPIVRFACGLTRTIERCTWSLTNDKNEVIASRTQYPLDLAWATTIHKAQGMTLDYVHVDLERCFGPGMAYVALSRCRVLQGLSVTGLSKSSVKVDPAALAFHQAIVAKEPAAKKIKVIDEFFIQ